MKATEIQKNLLHSLKLRRKNILSQWNNPIGTDTRHFFVDNLLPDDFVNEVFDAFPNKEWDLFSNIPIGEKN